MQRNKKYLLFLLFSCFIPVICFFSCQKEIKTTYEDRITGRMWKLSDYQVEGSPVISIFSSLDTCYTDNSYRFFYDGTYTTYEGFRKCNPDEPIEQRGTWSFSDNKKYLTTTDYKGERTTLDIITMEKEIMKFRYTDSALVKYLLIYRPK